MACFWFNQNECKITIPSTEEIANVTYYTIKVSVGNFYWSVNHRYSEFFELHNQLVLEHGISKDILPSKKVIRNKCPIFIEGRRKGLEEYLQKSLTFLKRTMPRVFVEFLSFNIYDIFFLLRDLSSKLYLEADSILLSKTQYSFSALEVHAISEFLRKPFPVMETMESRFDISPVLDFCSQLDSVNITGYDGFFGESNISVNKLSFELTPFKSMRNVFLKNVTLDCVTSLGNLRTTTVNLHVNNTNINSICQILQCDIIHKQNLEGSERWVALQKLDMSKNNITEIDLTVSLAPNLEELILNDNKLSTISNLSSSSRLSYLSLTNNLITVCDDLHTKIGNIKVLNLSQNNIVTCRGFRKLYSLKVLDLSFNQLKDVEEIKYLGGLPCLENLLLTGNSLATTVDYRIRVLEYFGDKASSVCLDNEKPSQSELDKVSVFIALRIVKEGKTPDLKNSFN